MGAVYEAKQISLDRVVALKTIRGRLANNASSMARFTREAYAAAQLTHHNVVQIYDFGEDSGRHFFSMEWVRGGPLGELVQATGPLDPKLAAGYALQAARGLQFAHRNGMVHRDVKPANLLLSNEGVVKVADLGLVKIPDQMDPESDVGASTSGMASGTQVTMQGTAVGTPAYMAPEQSTDAAAVDHRADIYSLGCTLFYLLTGRPPFDGSVISEVLEQHAHQPLPDITTINSRVPKPVRHVIERSMAKKPADRYETLAEMIKDLETYLGLEGDGGFSPSSAQADRWEDLAKAYSSATPMLRFIKPCTLMLIVVCVLLTLAMPFVGLGWILFGPAIFLGAVGTCLSLSLTTRTSPVVSSLRRWIGSLSWFDYIAGALGLALAILVTFVAGLSIGLMVGLVIGIALGAGCHFGMIVPSNKNSSDVVSDAEKFVRDLRIEGADEDGVRQFTARYGGKSWQYLFEAIFGYDALCNVRTQLARDASFTGSTSGSSLRDKICASLDSKTEINKKSRDHQRLAKIEHQGLKSEGLSEKDAKDRAWQIAAAVMDNAAIQPMASSNADAAAEAKRERMKAMLADARSGKYAKKRDPLAVVKFALSGQTRLLAGCLLLAVFAIWANQAGLLDQVKDMAETAVAKGSVDAEDVNQLTSSAKSANSNSGKQWSIGIAGLLLALSAFVSGWRMTPFALIATIVIVFGQDFGIPAIGSMLHPWMVAALAGVLIYAPGVIFGESRE